MSKARLFFRSRWAIVGAALAVLAGGGVYVAATGSPGASSFVPITPCRLMDTRPGSNVGPRSTPVGAAETYTASVWGSNGNCTIPSGATGLSMNVVAIAPTASSYLTVFPADKALPLSSSLNYVAGQAPTPNAVTVSVSVDGKVSFYNNAGSVDLAVDIVGYYEPATTGPIGPAGQQGPVGPNGASVKPAHVVWVAPSGGDYVDLKAAYNSIVDNGPNNRYVIRVAPGTYDETGGLTVKSYIDVRGSGEGVTVISCACAGTAPAATGASDATLRVSGAGMVAEFSDLTVTNTGPDAGKTAIAIFTNNVVAGAVTFRNVTATVAGTTNDSDAIVNVSSSPTFDHVTVTASGVHSYGFFNSGSSPLLRHVTVSAGGPADSLVYGVFADTGSSLVIRDSTVTVSAPGPTGLVTGVENDGGPIVVVDSSVLSSGSSFTARGVLVLGSSLAVLRSDVTATSASLGEGLVVDTSSTAAIDDSTLFGSTFAVIGVASTVEVRDSTVRADPSGFSVRVASGSTFRVANDALINQKSIASGTLTCIDDYDVSSGNPLSPVCT